MQTPAASSRHTAPRASDRALVARLLSDDESVRLDAWTKVIGEMVLPSVLHSRKWTEILEKIGETPESVASEVFLSLTADNSRNLRKFRFDCSFSSLVYEWTLAAMSTLQRAGGKEIAADLSETGDMSALIPQTHLSPDRALAARDALAKANERLAELWNDSPVHTTVMLLRNDGGLRAKEVASILGITPANVDQIHKRTLDRFKRLSHPDGL